RFGLRLLPAPGREELDDEPGHAGRDRNHADDEDDESEQAEDCSHGRPRIASCPARASSCWTLSARVLCLTRPRLATRDPTLSATSHAWSADLTCRIWRRLGSAMSNRSR